MISLERYPVRAKLKKCPCCNGRAKLMTHMANPFKFKKIKSAIRRAMCFTFTVRCLSCGLETKHFYIIEDAVKAWNKRGGR